MRASRFGKYEIVRKLGRSMSDVYLAQDTENGRRLVLKIVEECHDALTRLIVDAERRGAAIQQQLHKLDPRILEIYEFGELNGCFFVAMQYVEGRSLSEVLQQRTRLDPKTAARYGAEICSQLTLLHSYQFDLDGAKRAVVHGDVKPSNIQIDPSDSVWLLDFGIAKAITATRNLTQHNLGSPAYCSPERVKSGQVDSRADLWAAGVCLYEMIAGIPPYQAQTTRKLENLIASGRPPRALPPDCPPVLAAIVRKAIAADSGHRYSTAAAFERDLRAFLDGKNTVAEGDKDAAWQGNATVEKPKTRVLPERWRLTWSRWSPPRSIAFSLVAGLLVGFLIFIPAINVYRFWSASAPLRERRDDSSVSASDINAEWGLYQALEREFREFLWTPPAVSLKTAVLNRMVRSGENVIDGYRNSSAAPDAFDWKKARLCFRHALELDSSAANLRGREALCDGYARFIDRSATPLDIQRRFLAAASAVPNSPDPHLGLARLNVYLLNNSGQAIAELETAERLGYKLGPREREQQADAYRLRAERGLQQLAKLPVADKRKYANAIARDLDRARNAYEPIAEFSNVSRSLQQLGHSELLLQSSLETSRPKARFAKHKARYAKWR
jgi:serine/threonine protein kinase